MMATVNVGAHLEYYGRLQAVLQLEEEDQQPCEKEKRRKMGRHWVDVDGDQLMGIEREIADTLPESGSNEDEDDAEEIKALKV